MVWVDKVLGGNQIGGIMCVICTQPISKVYQVEFPQMIKTTIVTKFGTVCNLRSSLTNILDSGVVSGGAGGAMAPPHCFGHHQVSQFLS